MSDGHDTSIKSVAIFGFFFLFDKNNNGKKAMDFDQKKTNCSSRLSTEAHAAGHHADESSGVDRRRDSAERASAQEQHSGV